MAQTIRSEIVTKVRRIVIKIGTGVICDSAGGLDEEGLVFATGSHMLVGPLLEALAERGPGALLVP